MRSGRGRSTLRSTTVSNPLGIAGAYDLTDAASGFGWMFMGLSVALAAAALVVRLRRSTGYERQQLKWIAFAAAVTGVAVVADVISFFASLEGDAISQLRIVLLGIGFSAFPLAAGMAILRYRLYDIDVVINRTLVYGALTATLARRLPRQRAAAPAAPQRSHRRLGPRGRRLDARRGGPVPAGAAPDPGAGRPPLLPAQVRRRAHPRAFAAQLRDEVELERAAVRARAVVRETPCSRRTCRCGSAEAER